MRKQNKYRDYGVYVKIIVSGRVVARHSKKSNIVDSIRTTSRINEEFDVVVCYQKDVENAGTFNSAQKAIDYLNIWLEEALVKYCTGKGW